MRVLIVGAGSSGRRHAAHAAALSDVGVLDVDPARSRAVAEQWGGDVFDDLNSALAWSPHAAVVATPQAQHVSVAGTLVEAGVPVLVEKPLAHRLDEAEVLLRRATERGVPVFVVCNMRFHPGVDALRRSLSAVGRPLFARAHFGHWLPNMRPGVDYRTLYCAQAAEGGGVVLDGIHEIDYLSWLFGSVSSCDAQTARLSDLDVDTEDYAAMRFMHAGGVRCEVHLDYLQRCKRRGCEVVGTEGTLVWESEGKAPERCRVRLYRGEPGAWETLLETEAVDTEAPYRSMMARFVAAILGESADDDLLDGPTALHELRVALAARNGQPLGTREAGPRAQ